MAWSFNGRGKTETSSVPGDINKYYNDAIVATCTVTLGAAKGNRFTPVIDWIPFGVPFTVISNTGSTNTSGSASDQLYACYERGGTYFQVKNTLRDCNYADDTNQGTSFRSLDTNKRVRYVDPAYVGAYPYWKIRVLQAAVESTGKTIAFAVIVGADPKYLSNWRAKQ